MEKPIPFYMASLDQAIHSGEDGLLHWYRSYQANTDCANLLQESIADAHDQDKPIPADTAAKAVQEYGLDRVNMILASSVRDCGADNILTPEYANRARRFLSTDDRQLQREFVVECDSEDLAQLVRQVQTVYADLGLIDGNQCDSITGMNLTGKVGVLKPIYLSDAYKTPGNQLFLCKSGFGCEADANGRAVYGTHLSDGERCRHERYEFMGVIKPECMPGWASEKLQHMQHKPVTIGKIPPMHL